MDEGRLGMVIRQEDRHRKFVYMMNDIVRARLGLYNNFLVKEQHENTVRLVKDCVETRRAIVRQTVLRKCLEMRKRKVTRREGPLPAYGQYGGKPLWTMNREIEGVIAENHPRLRRLKRVKEVMRQSLESGAIMDADTVSRRMDAFFQLKQNRRSDKKSTDRALPADDKERRPQPPEGPQDSLRTYRLRKFGVAPPLPPLTVPDAGGGGGGGDGERTPASPRKSSSSSEPNTPRPPLGVADGVSLKVDSKGRLKGFRTKPIATIEELQEDQDKEPGEVLVDNDKADTKQRQEDRAATKHRQYDGDSWRASTERNSRPNEQAGLHADGKPSTKSKRDPIRFLMKHSDNTSVKYKSDKKELSSVHSDEVSVKGSVSDRDSDSKSDKWKRQRDDDRPRPKLILPPIQSSKALVSRK